jgi:zinc/manganese transport system substrate-binding protein
MARMHFKGQAMFRNLSLISVLLLGWALPAPASAEVRIFACEPEWAALAREIGGDKVTAYSATHEKQDPHHIRARPSLIAKIRRADLVFCSGAGLEIGWLPLLMQRGARAKIRPGTPGYFMAAQHVTVREKPAVVDRSMGDVHPDGNPHIHLDPRNILPIARELVKRLSVIDPDNSAVFTANLKKFDKEWGMTLKQWEEEAHDLKNMPIVVHHRSWSYLIGWLGLREIGSLEAKPGIPPTASHLQALLKKAIAAKTRAILRTPYDQAAPSNWLSERTKIPALVLPYTVPRDAKSGTLKILFDDILVKLRQANVHP